MLVLVLATFTICAAQPQLPGTYRGFDPQPEPPRWQAGYVHPGTLQGFNPQPDPPGVIRPGTLQGLNPQPLPPRWGAPQPLPPYNAVTTSPPGYYTQKVKLGK